MLLTMRILGCFLLIVTLLPLLATGAWYVRWWDFPRFQIAVLLLLPIAFSLLIYFRQTPNRESIAWMLLLGIALVWQASHVIQFSPLWQTEVPAANKRVSTFKIMVSNLDKNNHDRDPVPDQLASEQANVLLLIEYDDRWAQSLAELRSQYEFHHEEPRGEGLGMALWSNLPLSQAETQYIISDRRPSIRAKLELPSGKHVNFIGVHPTPPGLLDSTGDERRDSRVRDAELILIAKEIAARQSESWIVAGDFNDVAWSHTTRLFQRISGLRDPRIGRSFMGTYMAQYPPCRFPIDHVFLSAGFSLSELSRKRIAGSDHFAVLASVSLAAGSVRNTPTPEGNDPTNAEKIIEEGIEDAEQRDVLTDGQP